MNNARQSVKQESAPGDGLYSVGHSNHTLDHFLHLLIQSRIEAVADVRSEPHSRYSPHFDREQLRPALEREGIRYWFLGRELGGRPAGDEFYDPMGRVKYDRLAESPRFQEGIRRLRAGLADHRMALMCSEEDPRQCHRYLLVARVLEQSGVPVLHVRGDGRIQTAADLEDEAARERGEAGQLTLFESTEEQPWRSIRSVSPRSVRPTSSER